MAEIKMIHQQGYCLIDYPNTEEFYGAWCHHDEAYEGGCPCYCRPFGKSLTGDEDLDRRLGYSPCVNAETLIVHKGMSVKRYEAYIGENPYTGEECAVLEVGKRKYYCPKLVIDGEQIFPEEGRTE